MSAFPSDIPGFGSVLQPPRPNPRFAPGPDLTTEDYYVFSRCDGHVTARDIVLMVGLGVDKGCAIIGKLRRLGAVLVPGETAEALEAARASEARGGGGGRRSPTEGSVRGRPIAAPHTSTDPARPSQRTLEGDSHLGALSAAETAAMAETVDLGARERERVLELVRRVAGGDVYDLLGLARPEAGAALDKRELKRAYFKLSKEFHPDRYYRKSVGSFGPWLTHIFEAVTRGFEVLSDDRQRAAYDARLRGDSAPPPVAPAAQSRAEHAASLFDRACALENRGELEEATRTFAAALRIEASPRTLRRAARCCLAAGQLVQAEEYARKGARLRPADAAYARVLAEVLLASQQLAEAEATLVRALEQGTDNDVLVGELRSDLAVVRAARRGAG